MGNAVSVLKTVDSNIIPERRSYPRYSVEYVSEVYLCRDILFTTIVDISQGGAGIRLPKGFKIGSLFDLRINYKLCESMLAKFERINIRIKAELIWIKKMDSIYRGGLKIIDIDFKDLSKLKKYLYDLEPSFEK